MLPFVPNTKKFDEYLRKKGISIDQKKAEDVKTVQQNNEKK